MTRIDAVVRIIDGYLRDYEETGTDPKTDCIARALYEAGLLAPAPRIIRTVEELKALHPATVVLPVKHRFPESAESLLYMFKDPFADEYVGIPLPAVVVATGEHVRACRQALEGGAG